MKVFIVRLKTTGQVWSTTVCANFNKVSEIVNAHNITLCTFETDSCWDFYNPDDMTQQATVSRVELLGS